MRQVTVRVHMVQVGDVDMGWGSDSDSATGIEGSRACSMGILVVVARVVGLSHMFRVVVRYGSHGYPSLVIGMSKSDDWVT